MPLRKTFDEPYPKLPVVLAFDRVREPSRYETRNSGSSDSTGLSDSVHQDGVFLSGPFPVLPLLLLLVVVPLRTNGMLC